MFRALFRKSWLRRLSSKSPTFEFLDARGQILVQWGRPQVDVNFDGLQQQEKETLETLIHVAEASSTDSNVNQSKIEALQAKLGSLAEPDERAYNKICQMWINIMNYRIQKSEQQLQEVQQAVKDMSSISSTPFLKAELLQLQAHVVVLSVVDAMEPSQGGKFSLPKDWNVAAIFETVEDCVERESIPIFENLGYTRDVLACYDFLISFYQLWRSIEETDIFDEKYVNLKLMQAQEKRHGFAQLLESRDIQDSDFNDGSETAETTTETKEIPASASKSVPFAKQSSEDAFKTVQMGLGRAANAFTSRDSAEYRRWGAMTLIWAFIIPIAVLKILLLMRNQEENKPPDHPTYKRRTRPNA